MYRGFNRIFAGNFCACVPTFRNRYFRSQIEKQKLYFTVRFGTSVPKSKSGSHISLFVLELSLPNRKEKADLPQFALEQIEKPRTFRFHYVILRVLCMRFATPSVNLDLERACY